MPTVNSDDLGFRNEAVAAKYDFLAKKDLVKNIGSYHGKLSRITPEVAELLIATQDPHIKLKEPKTSARVASREVPAPVKESPAKEPAAQS